MDTPQANELCLLDGFWERLISLMDVSGAAIALVDEDQKDALHAFFDRYADHMIECIRRVKAEGYEDYVTVEHFGSTHQMEFLAADIKYLEAHI